MDERNLRGRAPWWFRKLAMAETANYTEMRKTDPMYGRRVMNARTDGGDPVVPIFEGDELTLAQKLAKYGIVYEDGDEDRSQVYAAKTTPIPVPRLGTYARDHDEDIERGRYSGDDMDFG